MQFGQLKRRDFIAILGGAMAAWPCAVRAQQSRMPILGFLSGRSSGEAASAVSAFHQGWAILAIPRAGTSSSNIVGQKVGMIDCQNWRPTSSGVVFL
jgi:hypothetical protein